MGGALLLAAVSTEPLSPNLWLIHSSSRDVLRDALREHYEGLRTV